MYEELIKRFNAIDASKLVDKTDYNSKIKYIEDKQPSISNLATAAALLAVESDVSNFIDVVKKNQIVMQKQKKLRVNILDEKINQKDLVHKSDHSGFINKTYLNRKIKTLPPKAELKAEQDKIVKLQKRDLFSCEKRFGDHGSQNMFVYKPTFSILDLEMKKAMNFLLL